MTLTPRDGWPQRLTRKEQEVLEVVYRHDRAEWARDIEGVMATLSAHPRYYIPAVNLRIEGREAVRTYYESVFANDSLHHFEILEIRQWVAGDGSAVFSEQVCRRRFTGDFFGMPIQGTKVVDIPSLTVIPFEGGLMAGERHYWDRATVLR